MRHHDPLSLIAHADAPDARTDLPPRVRVPQHPDAPRQAQGLLCRLVFKRCVPTVATELRLDIDSPTLRATAKLLQPLLTPPKSGEKVDVEILTRSKDEAENKKLFEQIIRLIGDGVRILLRLPRLWRRLTRARRTPAQNKVGALPKDKMTGKFVTEWQNVLKESGADVKEVDVALGVSALLAVKDSEELVRIPFPVSCARCRGEAHPE